MNRPAPIVEIAVVIVDVYCATLNSYSCIDLGKDAPEELSKCEEVLSKLEEAWLIVETEAGASMPPGFRFAEWHEESASPQQ